MNGKIGRVEVVLCDGLTRCTRGHNPTQPPFQYITANMSTDELPTFFTIHELSAPEASVAAAQCKPGSADERLCMAYIENMKRAEQRFFQVKARIVHVREGPEAVARRKDMVIRAYAGFGEGTTHSGDCGFFRREMEQFMEVIKENKTTVIDSDDMIKKIRLQYVRF